MATDMASSLLNGDRAVVLLFVSSILYSTRIFLLYEGLSFSVESYGSAFPFRTSYHIRPGDSSGILLGTVTLPGVEVSKLAITVIKSFVNA